MDATDLDAQWLWPIPLILGGLFIFLAAFRSEPEPAVEVAAEMTGPADSDEASTDEGDEPSEDTDGNDSPP